jgi:hypothetical protein
MFFISLTSLGLLKTWSRLVLQLAVVVIITIIVMAGIIIKSSFVMSIDCSVSHREMVREPNLNEQMMVV